MSLSLGGGAEDGEKYNNKKHHQRERERGTQRERERGRERSREREGACVDAVCN